MIISSNCWRLLKSISARRSPSIILTSMLAVSSSLALEFVVSWKPSAVLKTEILPQIVVSPVIWNIWFSKSETKTEPNKSRLISLTNLYGQIWTSDWSQMMVLCFNVQYRSLGKQGDSVDSVVRIFELESCAAILTLKIWHSYHVCCNSVSHWYWMKGFTEFSQ